MSLALWQILMRRGGSETAVTLTCEDCFAVLTLLAEAQALGVDADRLLRAAQRHLNRCPGCRQRLEQMIDHLAATLDDPPPADTVARA